MRVVLGLLGVVLLMTAIEWRSGHRFWRRADVGLDLRWALITAAGLRSIPRALIAVVAGVFAVWWLDLDTTHLANADAVRTALRDRDTAIAALPLPLQVGLALLLADLVGYGVHRLFHSVPFLWRFHAVHHSPVSLDWLGALRVHPVNELVNRLPLALLLIFLGFPLGVAGVAPGLLGLYGLLLHARTTWDFGPLRGIVASPHFHRWHHSADAAARGKNLAGLSPVWDRLFGTFHLPAGAPTTFGAGEPDLPQTVLGQLAWPFRRRQE